MLSWIFRLRLLSISWARLLGSWGALAILLAAPCTLADERVQVTAEVQEDAPRGSAVEITTGGYPPANTGGWFAFAPSSDDETFALDESSGGITLKLPEKLNARREAQKKIVIEHGRADETQTQTVRRKFLRAAGLSDREISRRLGLVTRYEITLRILPRRYAPEFPPRPVHFYWPAAGETIGEIQAQDADPNEEIRYRFASQEPEGWIEIDPQTGVLRRTNAVDSETSWRGTLEATDRFGLKATTTVWITEPLALPTLSISSLKSYWPAGSLSFFRGLGSEAFHSLSAIKNAWRFEPGQLANQMKTPPAKNEPPTLPSNKETVQTASDRQAVPSKNVPAVSSAAWIFSFLVMMVVSVLYVISRRKSEKSRDSEPETSKNTEQPGDVENPISPSSPDTADTVTENSNEPAQDEFAWENVLGSADEGDVSPSHSLGESPPAPFVETCPSPGPEKSIDPEVFPAFEEVRSEKHLTRLPHPHMDLPIAAEFQRDPLAILLDESQPAKPAVPSTEELNRLLSLLDDQLQEESAARADVDFAPQQIEPVPQREPQKELSVSEYMDNLLSKNTPPLVAPSTGLVPEEPASTPSLPESSQPGERSSDRQSSSDLVPQPVFSYDRETTRSQLEKLRATSNLTAANAIKKAASRRFRRNLFRWSLLVLVALGIAAARLFLLK